MNRAEVELSIIGTMLMDDPDFVLEGAIPYALNRLGTEDFLKSTNKKIFSAIKKAFEETTEPEQIRLKVKKEIKEEDLAYAVEFALLSKKQLEAYTDELIKMSIEDKKKEILSILSRGDIAEDEAFEKITRLNERVQSQEKRAGDAVTDAVKDMEKTDVGGICTGFPTLDQYILFRPEEISIIGARPGIGKTATAVYMSYQQLLQGKKVLFFSIELSAKQLMQRYISLVTGIPLRQILRNMLDDEEKDRIIHVADELKKLPLIIHDSPNLKVTMVYSKVLEYKPDIVYIDYVQRMVYHRRFNSPREFINDVSIYLTGLAKEYKIPIVVLAQLSRAAEKEPPSFRHLKESGQLEQDASNIILLHRTKDDKYHIKFIVAKCREGEAQDQIFSFTNGFPCPITPAQEKEEEKEDADVDILDF